MLFGRGCLYYYYNNKSVDLGVKIEFRIGFSLSLGEFG